MKMALVENIPPQNADSEMEEGEIVDDLSDISSEEEFLLRQRLQVLENYNNVLERKKAKRSSFGPGTKHAKEDTFLCDLSEISATELDDYSSHVHPKSKVQKRQKTHHRQKRKKLEPIVYPLKTKNVPLTREYKKKHPHAKKKLAVKIISESSDESEDEYRNRRRKLADAVVLNKNTFKNDKTSLSERLQKMLYGVTPEPTKVFLADTKMSDDIDNLLEQSRLSFITSLTDNHNILNAKPEVSLPKNVQSCELIDLCTDEDSKTMPLDLQQDTVDSASKEIKEDGNLKKDSSKENISDKDSDEDLELLRQHALKTKATKSNPDKQDVQTEQKILSEDEDSDTAELRLICLKSALLKKAIERKQKQKLKKRLSQSSNFPNEDDLLKSENNTDIESVDMDIGSDAEDKTKENLDGNEKTDTIDDQSKPELTKTNEKDIPATKVSNVDELEDDEDLLRAKLLTSLSKNLPNLVDPLIVDSIESVKNTKPPVLAKPVVPSVVPEEKRLIITVGDSDSEGEHEATTNLTKMHMKLSEQVDFQQKLDIFLKSTRMKVENSTLPDVVQQPEQPKKNEKFVAKAVKHLPKSEQIEYKNLVKRMAELEKIKQARQTTFNLSNKVSAPVKDTLKPRNVTVDSSQLSAINNLEEKIKTSRKNIAEESAKMLRLKEEGIKLSQKYKIVATELRNIKTAIALNKKQTSSMTSEHSKINGTLLFNKMNPRLQKENNPTKEEYKTPIAINRTVKVVNKENNLAKEDPKSVIAHKLVKDNNPFKEDPKNNLVHNPIKEVNLASELENRLDNNRLGDVNQELPIKPPTLSIRLDVTSNVKVVKIAGDKSEINMERKDGNENLLENERLSSHPIVEKGGGGEEAALDRRRLDNDDYRSPLDALGFQLGKETRTRSSAPSRSGVTAKIPTAFTYTPPDPHDITPLCTLIRLNTVTLKKPIPPPNSHRRKRRLQRCVKYTSLFS